MTSKNLKRDSASSVDENGNVSNSLLHHQMTEGVEYTDGILHSRKILKQLGMSDEDLDRIYPIEKGK